ncbi:MAG: metallophosphoesterase [Burkholderiales bacterium]|nr:metallophosphoesterase [Burkholderiales bacterium]
MKLHVLSDLHVEFSPFKPDLQAALAADVIVLAGDIHQGTLGMAWARQAFPGKPIIYVAGNHEFYKQHWSAHLALLRAQAALHAIHFLENDAVTIEGIRFLGATLWTDFEYFGKSRRSQNMRLCENALNDFRLIAADPLMPHGSVPNPNPAPSYETPDSVDTGRAKRLTAAHTLGRHQDSLAWLRAELVRGDPDKTVVVTHHFAHKHSCSPRWSNDPLTAIFGSKLPNEVLLGARLWIHGHTHDSCDYRLGDSRRAVRVVCNPRGYPLLWFENEFENARFDPALVLDIE